MFGDLLCDNWFFFVIGVLVFWICIEFCFRLKYDEILIF